MNAALRAKLEQARKRLNEKQTDINDNRHHGSRATREWARGEQKIANLDRQRFRDSLTDDERHEIEARLHELAERYPQLSEPHSSEDLAPVINAEAMDEYHFLRDLL